MDGGDERRQPVGQLVDLLAGEECRRRAGVGEAEDQRGVEPLIGGVVVGDVRGVPELLVPGHEHLGPEFLQHAGARERGTSSSLMNFRNGAGADAVSSPEVDQGSGSGLLSGAATSYQRDEFGGPA